MTKKEKILTVAMLFLCVSVAFVSSKRIENTFLSLLMQAPLIIGFFVGFRSGMMQKFAEKEEKIPSLQTFLKFILHKFTFIEPVIPLFSLSLAIGNILAIHNNTETINSVEIIFASFMVAYGSCIIGIVSSSLLEKVKLS